MFRSPARRRRLSVLLLLLFGRVLAPEAWLLVLHAHQHTQDEPAAVGKGKLLLGKQHTHCHADQLYDVPALRAGAVAVPEPTRRAVFAPSARPAVAGRPVAPPGGRPGRGPPVT